MIEQFEEFAAWAAPRIDAPASRTRALLKTALDFHCPYEVSYDEEYLSGLFEHKRQVMLAGIDLVNLSEEMNLEDFYLRLLIHDLSKLSAVEYRGYHGYNFKKKYENSTERQFLFGIAWLHHKNVNDHHPEYWFDVSRRGECTPIEMPEVAMFEMIADWIGAGKTYGTPLGEWLMSNIFTFSFHPNTAVRLAALLKKKGIKASATDGKILLNNAPILL